MFTDKNIEILSSREQIRNQLIEMTKDYMDVANLDLDQASFMTYIIDILSVLSSNLLFYSTTAYREMFLTKALQKESVLNLSSMLGYNPPLAKASKCSIYVEMPLTFKDTTNIKLYGRNNADGETPFKFYSNTIPFTLNNTTEIVVTVSGQTSSAIVREQLPTGAWRVLPSKYIEGSKTLVFILETQQIEELVYEHQIPNLNPYEFYDFSFNVPGQLASLNLVTQESPRTSQFADGLVYRWNNFNSLFLIPSAEKGFVYRQTEDGVRIFFGNGLIGQQPTSQMVCKVYANITQGARGNIISGSINKADKVYVNVTTSENNVISREVKFNFINVEPSYGGQDLPTVDDVRSTAIKRVSANNRLVTSYDLKNIKEIAPDLPLRNSTYVLKRSDIKTNEISLFTDLLFGSIIVPTINARIKIADIDVTQDDFNISAGNRFTFDSNEEVYVPDSNGEFVSLFNVTLFPENKESSYSYFIGDDGGGEGEPISIISPLNIIRVETPNNNDFKYNRTYIQLESSEFYVDTHNTETTVDDILKIRFNYSKVNDLPSGTGGHYNFNNLRCEMTTHWNNATYLMNNITNIDDDIYAFNVELPIGFVPDGPQTYQFRIYYLFDYAESYDPEFYQYKLNPVTGKYEYHLENFEIEASTTIAAKKNLDDYMYSQVKVTGEIPSQTIEIYDVPLIDGAFYDSVNKNDFDLNVYQRLISFDVSALRMTTDFINLKFSNTTGVVTNMRNNKETKSLVHGLNPISIPLSPTHGERYIVTNETNPWGELPGTIMHFNANQNRWIPHRMTINDFIFVQSLNKKMLFNGIKMIDPIFDIPLKIELEVWLEDSFSGSVGSVTQSIKTELLNKLSYKFGYDKSIYISEIIKIVQSVDGVRYCKVIKPEFDIMFNYDIYKDFTEEMLLDYTPQLVYFDSNSISIRTR